MCTRNRKTLDDSPCITSLPSPNHCMWVTYLELVVSKLRGCQSHPHILVTEDKPIVSITLGAIDHWAICAIKEQIHTSKSKGSTQAYIAALTFFEFHKMMLNGAVPLLMLTAAVLCCEADAAAGM